ncbi:unnamed protein product [Symbiodinium natans]|uniref:Uncharacterized protein n=1 Tax=Symbiodinium natans TaxID=878477 RepID=A0A812HD23_9DINO|nr:unnamed protein product [Symbiodinium natans]
MDEYQEPGLTRFFEILEEYWVFENEPSDEPRMLALMDGPVEDDYPAAAVDEPSMPLLDARIAEYRASCDIDLPGVSLAEAGVEAPRAGECLPETSEDEAEDGTADVEMPMACEKGQTSAEAERAPETEKVSEAKLAEDVETQPTEARSPKMMAEHVETKPAQAMPSEKIAEHVETEPAQAIPPKKKQHKFGPSSMPGLLELQLLKDKLATRKEMIRHSVVLECRINVVCAVHTLHVL